MSKALEIESKAFKTVFPTLTTSAGVSSTFVIDLTATTNDDMPEEIALFPFHAANACVSMQVVGSISNGSGVLYDKTFTDTAIKCARIVLAKKCRYFTVTMLIDQTSCANVYMQSRKNQPAPTTGTRVILPV